MTAPEPTTDELRQQVRTVMAGVDFYEMTDEELSELVDVLRPAMLRQAQRLLTDVDAKVARRLGVHPNLTGTRPILRIVPRSEAEEPKNAF